MHAALMRIGDGRPGRVKGEHGGGGLRLVGYPEAEAAAPDGGTEPACDTTSGVEPADVSAGQGPTLAHLRGFCTFPGSAIVVMVTCFYSLAQPPN